MTTTLPAQRTASLVERITLRTSSWLSATLPRRSVLVRAAVVGSALAVDPVGYVLKPGTAYASVCGPGASCSSGWTVFCCTVNRGRNNCPPGTIAAGWWKADGAGVCCGKPRYVIDCNAECTNCSTNCSHSSFCASSCWSCRCGCGPSGQCDQRRHCCNVFRYGQCHQEIDCIGPVACRVISCTPPWRWEACSTASATDNRTLYHSAPCQPGTCTPMGTHYEALGGSGSFLGGTVRAPLSVPGGQAQDYENGRIYYSSATGAWAVQGGILARYGAYGGTTSALGFPTTDPRTVGTTSGRYNDFQRGSIYYTPTTGAHAVAGAIHAEWTRLGRERSTYRYPVGDTVGTYGSGGWVTLFQGGSLYWTKAYGVQGVAGTHDALYARLARERPGGLGYPTTGTRNTVDGRGWVTDFERGAIVSATATGVHYLRDGIYLKWNASGRERWLVGYPTSDPVTVTGGVFNDFTAAAIYQKSGGSAFYVRGPILAKWREMQAEAGPLGWPVSDEYAVTGGRRSDFERGYVVYDAATDTATAVVTG